MIEQRLYYMKELERANMRIGELESSKMNAVIDDKYVDPILKGYK